MSDAPKDYGEHYEWLKKKAPKPDGPAGWIQWKGTDVCIDIHCKCGAHLHFDGEFMYYIECSECGTLYAAGQWIPLIELPPEHAEFVRRDRPILIQEIEE